MEKWIKMTITGFIGVVFWIIVFNTKWLESYSNWLDEQNIFMMLFGGGILIAIISIRMIALPFYIYKILT